MIAKLYERIHKATTRNGGDFGIVAKNKMVPLGGIEFNVLQPPTYCDDKKKTVVELSAETPNGDKNKKKKKNKAIRYHIEDRVVGEGSDVMSVVTLDSHASYVKRLKMAAHAAYIEGVFETPHIQAFSKTLNRQFSVFLASHGVVDGWFRDSNLPNGKPFFTSEYGEMLRSKDPMRVRKAMLELFPVSLLFGMWASTLGVGSNAYKHAKCFIGEIIGGVGSETLKSGSRIDALKLKSLPIIYSKACPQDWRLYEVALDKNGKPLPPDLADGEMVGKLSDVNHSNIPPTLSKGGVSVKWVEDKMFICTTALFQYVTGTTPAQREDDAQVRAYLVCAGLYMHALRSQNGFLRSGCNIRPVKAGLEYQWDGFQPDAFELTPETAHELYQMALAPLVKKKLVDPTKNVQLQFSDKMEKATGDSCTGDSDADLDEPENDQ